MAYSESKITVERRMPLLKELSEGRSCKWTTPPGRAQALARQIREALAVAAKHPEDFPGLASAAGLFKIEVPNSTTVQAVIKERPTVQQEMWTPPSMEDVLGEGRGGGGSQTFGAPQARVGLVSAAEVIDAWAKHLPSNDLIHFPQTILPYDELLQLYHWARTRRPRLMFFVPEGSLTLSVAEDDVEAHSWHPAVAPTVETFPNL